MTGCSRWTGAITDCALGETPEPELAAHLATCPECRNLLQQSQAMAARVEGALRRAAAVEPPLYGPDRVMAQVARRRVTPRLWRWAALGSAALAVVIAAIMWVRPPAPEPEAKALTAWRSPTQSLLRPPVAAAWTTRPLIEEEFFKIQSLGETHAN